MTIETLQVNEDNRSAFWGQNYKAVLCEHCDWRYLVPRKYHLTHCPNCYQSKIVEIGEEVSEMSLFQMPELYLPFQLTQKRIENSLENFAQKIPFSPTDLNTVELHKRLRALYLPMWLVDANIQAKWKAEAGFDYQVISHQARYDDNQGGWDSREVKEGRIRWEPRLGTLQRSYQNIPAPALEEHNDLDRNLGGYDLHLSQPFQLDIIEDCLVRLPNRSTQDAWSDAKPALQLAASEECRQAASADHMRQFSWQATYLNQNWTILLLPVYSTYYLDDERRPISILINGQNGKISGIKRASMKRAQHAALIILSVGGLVFLLSLIIAAISLLVPSILIISVIGIMIALLVATAATIPLLNVWWFNKNQ